MDEIGSGAKSSRKERLITTLEASVTSLSKQLGEVKSELQNQRNESKNVIIGVLVAFIFIAVTVAVEVMLFHTNENTEYVDLQNQYSQASNKFYSKDELSGLLEDAKKSRTILECLKLKGYFSLQCFNLSY